MKNEDHLNTLYQLEDIERQEQLRGFPCRDEAPEEEIMRRSIEKEIREKFCDAPDDKVACELQMPIEWREVFQQYRYEAILTPRKLAIVALTQPRGTLTAVKTLCAINSYLPFQERFKKIEDLPESGNERLSLLNHILVKPESEWPVDLVDSADLSTIELIQKTQINSAQAFEFYFYASKLFNTKQLASIALSQARFIAPIETTLAAIQAHTSENVTIQTLACPEARERLLQQVQSYEHANSVGSPKNLLLRLLSSSDSNEE